MKCKRETAFVFGINAIGTRHSGAATVLRSLIEDLLRLPETETIVVFANPHRERLFNFPNNEALVVIDAPGITNHPIARFVWLQTKFARWVKKYGCDVIYNMNNFAGPLPVPQALLIQQSLYLSQDALRHYLSSEVSWSNRLRLLLERLIMPTLYRISISHSQAVVVQTKVMKETVHNHLKTPNHKLYVLRPDLPIIPTPQELSPHLSPMKQQSYRHWIYVGNHSPYKNLGILMRVAELALQNNVDWLFHMLGGGNQSLWNNPLVHWYPYLNGPELAEAYSLANGLIMPSLTETVGLPMIEAISAGTPVIAADLPYAREICGSCAFYFDPHSPRDLYNKLQQVQNRGIEGDEICRHRDRAKRRFSSRENHEGTWPILKQIMTDDSAR